MSDFTNLERVEIKEFKANKISFFWLFKVGIWLRKNKVTFLISPSNLMLNLWFPRTIQIIHDVIPLTHKEFWPKSSSKKFKWQLFFAVTFSKHVATISQTTKKELLKIYPKVKTKTTNIGIGLHEWTKRKVTKKEKIM